MANASAATTQYNAPNYVGELFLIGQYATPFINRLGGPNPSQRSLTSTSFEFPLNQQYSLESASQPAITENDSLTAPTPTTYVRSQDTNYAQIFQYKVSVSYQKQSHVGLVSGLANVDGSQPIRNEREFQIMANLKKMAIDMEYTFLNGSAQDGTNTSTAYKTRGIVTACTSNTVAAANAQVSKSLIDQLLRDMAGNGAELGNGQFAIMCNAFQRQVLSEIYGLQERRDNVGGVSVQQIITDFDVFEVIYAPYMDTDDLLIVDLSKCAPVFVPVPGKGFVFTEELSKSGASEDLQLYAQAGIGYGAEEFHGTITGLATS